MKKILLKILEGIALAGMVVFLGFLFLIELIDLFIVRPLYQKLCVNPKTGTTFYFDGRKYEHEVKPVKNGTRYTLAIWYTDHEDFDWQKVRENELNDMYSDKYSDMYRIV